MVPTNADALLVRKDAAAALTEAGYPTSYKTLESMVTRGGGPIYRKFGGRVLYRWADLLDWAEKRMHFPCNKAA
ncbi:DNA-binding protein [Roseomonas sp. FDAARGOS_362]|uniref:hypothetical protein n=1 Tax=Roseomonas TaxID=125216 RepID=UPI00096A7D79|nr:MULTISPECIES: hypothetical protein [Roseomonas]ATR20161.1 DNA-binding protein [Roseomonas sp. FDAARGOS_362]MDT8261625.1 hypothetical protein [Roseomonas sp. DSM 102946]